MICWPQPGKLLCKGADMDSVVGVLAGCKPGVRSVPDLVHMNTKSGLPLSFHSRTIRILETFYKSLLCGEASTPFLFMMYL